MRNRARENKKTPFGLTRTIRAGALYGPVRAALLSSLGPRPRRLTQHDPPLGPIHGRPAVLQTVACPDMCLLSRVSKFRAGRPTPRPCYIVPGQLSPLWGGGTSSGARHSHGTLYRPVTPLPATSHDTGARRASHAGGSACPNGVDDTPRPERGGFTPAVIETMPGSSSVGARARISHQPLGANSAARRGHELRRGRSSDSFPRAAGATSGPSRKRVEDPRGQHSGTLDWARNREPCRGGMSREPPRARTG